MEKIASCLTVINIQVLGSPLSFWWSEIRTQSSLPEFVFHPRSTSWHFESTHTMYNGSRAILSYLILCLLFWGRLASLPYSDTNLKSHTCTLPDGVVYRFSQSVLGCRIISETFGKWRHNFKWSRRWKKTLSSLTETEQSENHLLLMAKHNKEDKAGDIDKFWLSWKWKHVPLHHWNQAPHPLRLEKLNSFQLLNG